MPFKLIINIHIHVRFILQGLKTHITLKTGSGIFTKLA